MRADPEKKRRWFQVHLSTCIVLMFVAAGLVWLNLKARPAIEQGSIDQNTKSRVGHLEKYYTRLQIRGWPYEFQNFFEDTKMQNDFQEALREPGEIRLPGAEGIHLAQLSLNILFALAILAATAFGCEWWVRRRGGRQQAPHP